MCEYPPRFIWMPWFPHGTVLITHYNADIRHSADWDRVIRG